mgnify:CR=1 FL=1
MTETSVVEQILTMGWIKTENGQLVASDEINRSLGGLYRAIEENASWKESFLSAFKRPGTDICSVEEFHDFTATFSFGMRNALIAVLCDEIERWCLDNDTPFGSIVSSEYFLCRYQIVPFALYNRFILGI